MGSYVVFLTAVFLHSGADILWRVNRLQASYGQRCGNAAGECEVDVCGDVERSCWYAGAADSKASVLDIGDLTVRVSGSDDCVSHSVHLQAATDDYTASNSASTSADCATRPAHNRRPSI